MFKQIKQGSVVIYQVKLAIFDHLSLAVSKKSKNIDEDHNDIKVEHQSTNNVIIVVHYYSIMSWSIFNFSTDDHSINDQIQTVEDKSKAAVESVKTVHSDAKANNQKWEHSQVNDKSEGSKYLDICLSSHCVDC